MNENAARKDNAARKVPRPSALEEAVVGLALDAPELGQAAVAERLRRKGLAVSASGVRYIWQKHGLETAVKRLQAVAARAAGGRDALTDAQRALLERGTLTARLAGDDDGKAPDRRRLILEAAAELFAERGYDRCSIRDIAARVGLLPGSVYHHFESKDALYLAVHGESFARLMGAVRDAIARTDDPWERLLRACELHVSGITSGSAFDRVTGHNLAVIDHGGLFAKMRPLRAEYENVFRALIDDLPVAAGIDRSVLRLLLLSGMNWVFIWYREGRLTPQQIAARMIDIVRRGAEAPPASPAG